MAEVDLTFLGEQMKRMQDDVRSLRAEQLRLDSDVARIRAEMAAGFAAMDARFDQVHQTMTTNLAVVLEALKDRK